jgi:hypothetical protein
VIWQVFIGVAGIGLLASLFMKGLPLHTEVDRQWALEGEHTAEGGRVPEGNKSLADVDVESHPLPVVPSGSADES